VLLGLLNPCQAQEALFDADRNHAWNRLRDALFTRKLDDGATYQREELEPPFQMTSKFLLEGPSHATAIALLDAFLSRHEENLIQTPLKRAVFQRDLWAVFGTTAGTGTPRWWEHGGQVMTAGIDDTGDEPFGRKQARRKLQKRLAAVIRRIALTPAEIAALPDNLSQAATSGSFGASYDPAHAERAFLPAELAQKDGPWVLVSNTDRGDGLAAPIHVQFTNGRSLFLVFLRVSEGREAAKAYLARVANGKSEQLPEGAQVALVRRTLLIDNHGNLCLSPLTEEVQFRVFKPTGAVDSYELRLDRKDLFAGRRGGLRAIGADETTYYDITGFHGGGPAGTTDLLETEPRPQPLVIMDCCVTCHRVHVAGTIRSISSALASGRRSPDLQPTTLDEQVRHAFNWTKKTYSWGLLQGFWETQH
jgi:hypothetical protein